MKSKQPHHNVAYLEEVHECPGGDLSMDWRAAILHDGLNNGEGEHLNVGIFVRRLLLHGANGVFGRHVALSNTVAYLQDGIPVGLQQQLRRGFLQQSIKI